MYVCMYVCTGASPNACDMGIGESTLDASYMVAGLSTKLFHSRVTEPVWKGGFGIFPVEERLVFTY